MTRIISIHYYRLKESVSSQVFMDTIKRARKLRLFVLPGLEHFQFLRGIKGARQGEWSAIWIYSSQKSWEALWGSTSKPKTKEEYPQQWIRWEDELLGPLLEQDPDRVNLTAYEEMFSSFSSVENP